MRRTTPTLHSPERQVSHLTFPFTLHAAFGQQKNIFDCSSYRNFSIDFEYTRHQFTGPNTLIGVASHRRGIVGKYHPALLGCPFQDSGIIRA